jgi:hypothetical protein
MPTRNEREYYSMGFQDGIRAGRGLGPQFGIEKDTTIPRELLDPLRGGTIVKRKRKLSPWNKFVKANSKKPRFIYKSGSNKGKLNLKKMGVAFRKTPAGKKKK